MGADARVRAGRGAAAAAAALLALWAGEARGAVDGGPHDVIAQGYDTARVAASRERCDRCHIPGRDVSGLLPRLPPVLAGAWGEGDVACFSCHDGTTIVSPEVDASMTAFHPASHGHPLMGSGARSPDDLGLPVPATGRQSCLTCHDPHDNSRRPFLRVALGELCVACHSPLAGSGTGAANLTGNHPMGPLPEGGGAPGAPLAVGGPFRVPFPAAYPLRGGSETAGVHWDLGGHLSGGGEGELTCTTCHAVHGDEGDRPRPRLLAVDPVRVVADRFCEGCHAGERGDGSASPPRPNPGGTRTGRTYHPCDDDGANGEGWALTASVPESWPVGEGSPPRLLCPTCHVAHGSQPAVWLTRTPDETGALCEECHRDWDPENHHPLGGDGPCSGSLPPSVASVGGRLACAGCHRAHNAGLGSADERLYVPLLRESSAGDACLACHPADNPTCNDRPEFRASHFIGDPAEEYGDPDPPLLRDPWPASGLRSRYGPPEETSVTCLSCHAFGAGAVVAGDDGTAGWLLARSGNPVEWVEGGELTYLCTGCHTASPGTGGTKGHSHPMMNADGAALTKAAELPVTLTPGLKMNCDSCHRPHEAPTGGGFYILEEVRSPNEDPRAVHPRIDSSGLCGRCHDATKY